MTPVFRIFNPFGIGGSRVLQLMFRHLAAPPVEIEKKLDRKSWDTYQVTISGAGVQLSVVHHFVVKTNDLRP